MKNILILALLILTINSNAADTSIVISQIKYSELFETAKKENKAVMLYFHFDGCGACVQMEKTVFKDKQVKNFYNSNFVNFEVNTRKGEGIEINKVYNVQLHPTFIFLDNSGKELHKIVGVFSPEEFLLQAQNVLKSNKTLSNYKDLYNKGNRNSNFLYEYTYMLRNASQLDSKIVNEYLSSLTKPELQQEKNIRFIYEFCLHNFKIHTPFQSATFTFLLQNKDKFYTYFDKDQVHTRIVWILNNSLNKAIEERDEKTFNSIIEILKEFDTGEEYLFKEMDGRLTGILTCKHLVLESKLDFYDKNKDITKYNQTLNEYISKIWDDANELNSYAWNTYKRTDDKDKIITAIKCSIRSIELKNTYANNDTYACLLYKTGDFKKAMKQAEKAVEIAKLNNEDHSDTTKLIDKIKEEKK